jgi:hypothetical protein
VDRLVEFIAPSRVSRQWLSSRGVSLPSSGSRPSPVPRFPRSYEGATTSPSVSASAYEFRSRSPRLTSSFVPALSAHSRPTGGLRRAWSSGQPGDPFPVLRSRGRFGTSQVRSAILAAPLPSSRTPAEPMRPRHSRSPRCCPRAQQNEGFDKDEYFGANPGPQRPLSTLHESRRRLPCKTRFRPAGWPLPGESRTRWIASKGFRSLHGLPPFRRFA